MVTLNAGGTTFITATATLTRFPDTMLGAMFSGRHALIPDQNGAYCIDRDGRYFHYILNFLRRTASSCPKEFVYRFSIEELEELKIEADFYGVKHLMFPEDVRIKGATGSKANDINGLYEATEELSGDMPVYAKAGNFNSELVYIASTNDWSVQTTAMKGAIVCLAYCKVPKKCLPQECPAGKWKVVTNSDSEHVAQPAIIVNAETRGW